MCSCSPAPRSVDFQSSPDWTSGLESRLLGPDVMASGLFFARTIRFRASGVRKSRLIHATFRLRRSGSSRAGKIRSLKIRLARRPAYVATAYFGARLSARIVSDASIVAKASDLRIPRAGVGFAKISGVRSPRGSRDSPQECIASNARSVNKRKPGAAVRRAQVKRHLP
jgi:hypothetical protein